MRLFDEAKECIRPGNPYDDSVLQQCYHAICAGLRKEHRLRELSQFVIYYSDFIVAKNSIDIAKQQIN
jgi:hypothetical protein